jgi:hypothetical protein
VVIWAALLAVVALGRLLVIQDAHTVPMLPHVAAVALNEKVWIKVFALPVEVVNLAGLQLVVAANAPGYFRLGLVVGRGGVHCLGKEKGGKEGRECKVRYKEVGGGRGLLTFVLYWLQRRERKSFWWLRRKKKGKKKVNKKK